MPLPGSNVPVNDPAIVLLVENGAGTVAETKTHHGNDQIKAHEPHGYQKESNEANRKRSSPL